MSLSGNGVVAIWNDITEEGRANFYEWHNREHIPERVGISGFLRGRRYIAINGAPQYFTLYEVENTAVLSSDAYLTRLNRPTVWTVDSVRHFRNVARSLCATDWSAGSGSGGYLGTLRFDCGSASDPALMDTLMYVLKDGLETASIVSAHICRADIAVSSTKTAEQKGRPENAVPRWIILIEASTPEALDGILSGALSEAKLATFALTDAARGLYQLQFDLLAGR
jgi:hypothetical protein